jgi:cation diffusion facilitator family transporter
MATPKQPRASLTRFAWLSIAAALLTIFLKTLAWWLTGSVGLLSDALESVVNLVAALAALLALHVAEQEPDEDHAYGHSKAEYFSSSLEGMLILLAAGMIVLTAIPRLFDPVPVERLGIGIAVSIVAALINLAVAQRLMVAARVYRSITLEADAKHLRVDFWTTAGVVVAIALTGITGWDRLDALIALVVAANIVLTGYRLIRSSMLGLLDTAISPDEMATVDTILNRYRANRGIETHALRTRQAGSRQFVSFHLLVPGEWSVERGHDLAEQIEQEIRAALPGTTVFTHVEPVNNPISWADAGLDGAPPGTA